MAVLNPKLIIFAVLIVAILLISQAGNQAATVVTQQKLPNLAKDFPFKPFIPAVDEAICKKIQAIAKSNEPCEFKVDSAKTMLKLVIGQRLVATVEYGKHKWAEIDEILKGPISRITPQFYGKDMWGEYVDVQKEFQMQGIGSYILPTADSMLQSGLVRLALDMEGWLKVGISLPNDARLIYPQIYIFMTK